MARIITDGLTPLQVGRLNAALDKPVRIDGAVTTWRAYVATLPGDKRESNDMASYSRTRFNRMNGREQEAYIKRLEARRVYMLAVPHPTFGTVWQPVAKVIFDAVAREEEPEDGPEYLTEAEAAELFGDAPAGKAV